MLNLRLVRDSGTDDFICGIEGWLQRSEDKEEWQILVSHVVSYAFTSRLSTLITISPMQWSIGHTLAEPRRLSTSRIECLLNTIKHCSADLLTEIAQSEEFQRGLLWLSALSVREEQQLFSIINQIDLTSADPPVLDYELLLLLDDARQIYWLHPSKDVKILADEVLNIALRNQWQVSV